MGVIAKVVQYLLICIEGVSDTGLVEGRYAGKRLSFFKGNQTSPTLS